jgi:RNA polymerase sigma-70 factor (ECF subfamily)
MGEFAAGIGAGSNDSGSGAFASGPATGVSCSPADVELLAALRRHDEAAFSRLVAQHHNALLRVARTYVSDGAVAEEVVQETWLGVLRGLNNFEGRCSLKTWIFQILINRARTRGQREARSIPFSALAGPDTADEPAVDPGRFAGPDSEFPNHWLTEPRQWDMTPEQLLLSQECRTYIEQAIAELPPLQNQVITLRDVQGWTSEEICNALQISESNCRVLLHRARSRVRRALESYLGVGQSRPWELRN